MCFLSLRKFLTEKASLVWENWGLILLVLSLLFMTRERIPKKETLRNAEKSWDLSSMRKTYWDLKDLES